MDFLSSTPLVHLRCVVLGGPVAALPPLLETAPLPPALAQLPLPSTLSPPRDPAPSTSLPSANGLWLPSYFALILVLSTARFFFCQEWFSFRLLPSLFNPPVCGCSTPPPELPPAGRKPRFVPHPPLVFSSFIFSPGIMMMGATSFVNHAGSRPPRYRTPSPPRRAVEPITPSSTTTDFRASWAERSAPKAASVDRDQFTLENGRHAATDGAPNHRSGHGRSNSTIDTLATIALATSPTFAPLSYRPPSQSSTPAMPLFPPEPMDSAVERPAKRQRSEKDPSPSLHFPQIGRVHV